MQTRNQLSGGVEFRETSLSWHAGRYLGKVSVWLLFLKCTQDESKQRQEDAASPQQSGHSGGRGCCVCVCVQSIRISILWGQTCPNAERVCIAICCAEVWEGAGWVPRDEQRGTVSRWPASPVHSLQGPLSGHTDRKAQQYHLCARKER